MIKNLFAFFIFCCFSIIVYSQEKIEITNIIITGNKITKDDVLLRELTFKKGDIVTIQETKPISKLKTWIVQNSKKEAVN